MGLRQILFASFLFFPSFAFSLELSSSKVNLCRLILEKVARTRDFANQVLIWAEEPRNQFRNSGPIQDEKFLHFKRVLEAVEAPDFQSETTEPTETATAVEQSVLVHPNPAEEFLAALGKLADRIKRAPDFGVVVDDETLEALAIPTFMEFRSFVDSVSDVGPREEYMRPVVFEEKDSFKRTLEKLHQEAKNLKPLWMRIRLFYEKEDEPSFTVPDLGGVFEDAEDRDADSDRELEDVSWLVPSEESELRPAEVVNFMYRYSQMVLRIQELLTKRLGLKRRQEIEGFIQEHLDLNVPSTFALLRDDYDLLAVSMAWSSEMTAFQSAYAFVQNPYKK